MSWPDATREPVSRTWIRAAAVVRIEDAVTGRPPQHPPPMRLQRLGTSDPVDLTWTARLTVGGAVVFSGFDRVDPPPPSSAAPPAEDYLLIVEPDPALRPEQLTGYRFTVPPDPARWPVDVVVRLLPGPAYPYAPQVPSVHGQVLRPGSGRVPVAGAVVSVTEDAGEAILARAGADHKGRFTAGLLRYRTARTISAQATAPDGTVGTPQPLT